MLLLSRLPEGKTLAEYETELSAPFSVVWYALRDGEIDQEAALPMLMDALPEWFPALEMAGGPGLIAPGRDVEVTLNLAPGNYVLECYVKTEDGEIHYMDGMIRPMTVREEPSGAAPPVANARITLSNSGVAIEGDLKAGRRTVEVHVAENPEAGFGHSLHLARLDADADADRVVGWMNWFDLAGLRTPAPVEFVGGLHPMPVGSTAYFVVNLEPGRYLAVSEATGAQGVLKEFTVR